MLRVFSNTGMETPRGPVPGSVESLAYGFGMALVRFKGIVETLNVACTTPIDEDNVDVRFHFSVKKLGGRSITRGVGLAFHGALRVRDGEGRERQVHAGDVSVRA